MPFGIKPRMWTDEERETVMHLLDSGVPASIIAEEFGITRNAAIGRIARDKELHAHQTHIRKPKKVKPIKPVRLPINPDARAVDMAMALVSFIAAKRGGKEPPPVQPSRPAKPAMRLLPLMKLGANQCRWPVKDAPEVPGGHLFCGADTAFGESYCAYHKQMAQPGGH
jgi:hypothetical protein